MQLGVDNRVGPADEHASRFDRSTRLVTAHCVCVEVSACMLVTHGLRTPPVKTRKHTHDCRASRAGLSPEGAPGAETEPVPLSTCPAMHAIKMAAAQHECDTSHRPSRASNCHGHTTIASSTAPKSTRAPTCHDSGRRCECAAACIAPHRSPWPVRTPALPLSSAALCHTVHVYRMHHKFTSLIV